MKNYKMIKNTVLAVCAFFAATGSSLYAGDAPNPWFGKKFSQDLDFVALGGEKGREIRKTPDGKQICVAHFKDKNIVRFGHVDGTNCMIGAWGAQPISLKTDSAKLVHVKKPGRWMRVIEAEQKHLISNNTALLRGKSSPSFIKDENAGGSYFPGHNATWFALTENGQWHERSNNDKNKIQIYVPGIADGVTPNPWFGKKYSDKMTLINLGDEKGRDILTNPDGKKVCAAYFAQKKVVRFGFVDSNDCRIGAWNAQAISLNSSFAKLVHVKDGGVWMSVTDAQNNGYLSARNMMIKGSSSPAFEPGKNATGGYYIQYKNLSVARNENGTWHERHFNNKDKIQMFVPGAAPNGAKVDAPNPWFGKKFSQDLDFVALGGEKGREILKTPEGKQICVAMFTPKNALRFGHVDGTNCMIGAWGAQPISLNNPDHSKLVHVKKPGKWVTVAEAEQKRLISNEKSLIKNESSPSFIQGENAGGSYQPHANRTWFARIENGQWHERNNADKNKIQIYVPGIADGVTPNPWFGKKYSDKMTLIKLGTEKDRKVLTTPEGKKICAAYFNVRDKKNTDIWHQGIRFGFVDSNDCHIGAWDPQVISLNSDYARLVHVKDGGSWMSVTDAQNKGYISDDNMMIKGSSSPAFEPGKNATGGYYIQYKNLSAARKENGTWRERHFNNKDKVQLFVPGVGTPKAKVKPSTADAPNPLFGVEYKHVQFMRPGGENGRKVLTLDGQPHQVCALMNKQGSARNLPGDSQLMFGHAALDSNGKYECRAAGWEGWKPYSFEKYPDATFLVHAPKGGVWKKQRM